MSNEPIARPASDSAVMASRTQAPSPFAIHSATDHSQLSPKDQFVACLSENSVRLSIGFEQSLTAALDPIPFEC